MKRIILLVSVIALLFSACGRPKNYQDCTYEQKRVLDAAGAFAMSNKSAKGAELTDDAVLVTAKGGTEYIFLPIRFTVDGTERTDVAMIKGNSFVAFSSDEIPADAYTGNASGSRINELLNIMECVVIWDNYTLYGEDIAGKSMGTEYLIVQSVLAVEKGALSDLFPRWAEYSR